MFKILGSGSSGNSAILVAGGHRLLIDAGFSAKRTASMLAEVGFSIEDLDAVFVTHEHGDHASGVEGLSKRRPDLRFFANQATAEAIQRRCEKQVAWKLFETGSRFTFNDIEIETVSLPHDAADPVGFLFRWGGGDLFSPEHSLAWMTDLGYTPGSLPERLKDIEAIVLEANYCERLLEEDRKRPWSVKQRISGRHGHLSNAAACSFATEACSSSWRHLFLVHLSRDCNSTEAVDQAFNPLRSLHPLLNLSVVAPGGATPPLDIL